MTWNNTRTFTLKLLTITAAGALPTGCMTLAQMAPPVGVELQRVGVRHQVDGTTLEWGRRLYLSECVRCHSVEPIGRYSESRWREILPRMGKKTKLDPMGQSALRAYIMSAHTYLEQESARLTSATNAAPDRSAMP